MLIASFYCSNNIKKKGKISNNNSNNKDKDNSNSYMSKDKC
jgi:hypothetical protein